MQPESRQLVRLLARDYVAELLGVLLAGPATAASLSEQIGTSRQHVANILSKLELLGLIEGTRIPPRGRRGPPEAEWRLLDPTALSRFFDSADSYALTVTEAKAERQRSRRRRRHLKVVK